MRVLLLNDTTNNFHLGCAAVANAIRRFIFGFDGIELRAIFNRELRCNDLWQLPPATETWLVDNLRWCDMLIVNGEGSLHHSRSPEIVRAIEIAAEEQIPFSVVNTILEDYPNILPLLARAELVTLRDEASFVFARSAGLPAERCADAALFASFSSLASAIPGTETGVTDWHPMAPKIAGRVSVEHLAAGARFFPFHRPDANWVWPEVVQDLGRFRHIVCGRYHGALFSLLAGRPITLLPSNSRKMRQLLVDLSIPVGAESLSELEPVEVSLHSARGARDQLLSMRSNLGLHPLYRLDIGNRKHRIGRLETEGRPVAPMVGLPEMEAPPAFLARRVADWLAGLRAPASRRERVRSDESLSMLDAKVLKQASEFLTLEDQVYAAAWTAEKLTELDTTDCAYPIVLELRNRAHSSPEANRLLALLSSSISDVESASAFTLMSDDQKPLSGRQARLAARVAGRAGNFSAKTRLLQAHYSSSSDVTGDQWRELAVSAALAAEPVVARDAALSALRAEPALVGWPGIQAANMLAANGTFAEGCHHLSRLLPSADENYGKLLERVVPGARGSVVYMPPLIGVGSAVIGLLPVLAGVARLDEPKYLIVDERLHPAFSRALRERISLLPNIGRTGNSHFGSVVNVFDLLAGFEARYREHPHPAVLAAESSRAAELREDYRRRFGDAELVGLAWHTSNPRSGRWRNLPLDRLRNFLSGRQDSVFISLQPIVSKAVADRDVIMQPNLFVDGRIDASLSIEDQLAQISVLDRVISIDCSAGIFAAALGIPTTIILAGEPTWQWPERRSFFANVVVVETLDEITR